MSASPYQELNLGDHVEDALEAVRENRARSAARLGLRPERVVWMRQVHGKDVAVVDTETVGPVPDVDGIVTTERGLALAVLVADCTPVLLADPEAGVAGAAHAGRLGLLRGVVPATVECMCLLGARPDRIIAMTGPAICGSCYEVPAGMQQETGAVIPESVATTRAGTPGLDIAAGVWAQLASAGVKQGERSPVCTLESPDHFSYRRTARTGRIAGYVWLAG